MHNWIQKLHTHTHTQTFIPLRHGFLSLGPFLQIAARHTHPPFHPTKAKSLSPGSPPSLLLLFPPFLHPFIHLASPCRFSNHINPHCKRQPNNSPHLCLLQHFLSILYKSPISRSKRTATDPFVGLKSSHSYLFSPRCPSIRLICFSSIFTFYYSIRSTPTLETEWRVGRQRQPALNCSWNWVIYSSYWILFLSWRFGSLQTYRASEQWEECLSGSGLTSPLPLRLSAAFLELFMTSVPTLCCQ